MASPPAARRSCRSWPTRSAPACPRTAALDLAAAVVSAADTVGEQAARTVTAALDQGAGREAEPFMRRGRMLLARAVATHTIDRAGHHLLRRAGEWPALAALVEDMRIGTMTPPRVLSPGQEG